MKKLILVIIAALIVSALVVMALPYVENIGIEPEPEPDPITYMLPSEILAANYLPDTIVYVEAYCWHLTSTACVLTDAPGETIEIYVTVESGVDITEGARVRAKISCIAPNSWMLEELISSEVWQ